MRTIKDSLKKVKRLEHPTHPIPKHTNNETKQRKGLRKPNLISQQNDVQASSLKHKK